MADDITSDHVDSVDGDWDQDGFHLRLSALDGEYDLRITDIEAARALIAAADKLRGWVAEHDRELAAYTAASPEERRRVLGIVDDEDELEPEPGKYGPSTAFVELLLGEKPTLADRGRTVIDEELGHDDTAGTPNHNRKV